MAKYRAVRSVEHASGAGQLLVEAGKVYDEDDFGGAEHVASLVREGYIRKQGGRPDAEPDAPAGQAVEGEPFAGATDMNAATFVAAAIAAAEEAGSDDGREAILRAALQFEQDNKNRSTVTRQLKEELDEGEGE